jgi:exopolyphosphatase/guanosine-5'-triphosphate,3'-diphosphate pyrophosphatase
MSKPNLLLMSAGAPGRIAGVRVAVIDVGSNTIRLLAAERAVHGVVPVQQTGVSVGLGSEIELRGRVSRQKLDEAALVVERLVREARQLGCMLIEVAVASPGRQAENGAELVRELAHAGGVRVRLLSREDEARTAYIGALAAVPVKGGSVAVCDVGGGSTQIAFGEPDSEPVWVRSIDIGSLRLATRVLTEDPPGMRGAAAAREIARGAFTGLAAPLPMQALAVGGSARAVSKLVGDSLGSDELREAIRLLRIRPQAEICEAYGVGRARAATLAAGAVILAEAQRRLGVPLEVVRAGLRDGLVLDLFGEAAALRQAAGDSAAG